MSFLRQYSYTDLWEGCYSEGAFRNQCELVPLVVLPLVFFPNKYKISQQYCFLRNSDPLVKISRILFLGLCHALASLAHLRAQPLLLPAKILHRRYGMSFYLYWKHYNQLWGFKNTSLNVGKSDALWTANNTHASVHFYSGLTRDFGL